jgi:hypothetical protein
MAKRAMLSDATVKAIADKAEQPRVLEDQTKTITMPPTQADNKPVKISASQRKQSAREVADRIAGNADISEHFRQEFARKTGTARFPVELMIDMWLDHPLHDPSKPGLRTADFIAAPIHGSYYEDGKTSGRLLKGSGNNKTVIAEKSNEMADKYNILVPKKGGGTKTQANGGSWYIDVASDHPLGSSLIAEIKEMELGLEETRKGKYKDEARPNLKTHKTNVEANLRSMASTFGKVFAMVKMFNRINSELRSQVVAECMTTAVDAKTRVLSVVTKPILVSDIHNRANWDAFSVGRFLSLDIDMAVAKGGTYQSLIDSAKPEETGEDNDDVQENTSIATAPDALESFQGLEAFMEDRGRYNLLLQSINAKDQREAEVYVTSIVNLSNMLAGLVKSHKLDKRFDDIMRRASAEAATDKQTDAA